MNFKNSLLVFCAIVCILLSVASVCASDVNDTQTASEDTALSMDTSDGLTVGESDRDVLSDGDKINAKIEIIDYPKNYGDDEVTFKLTTEDDNVALANVDLNVMAYAFNEDSKVSSDGKLALADFDFKLSNMGDINDFATITTNSKGIAVYKVPSMFTGQFTMMVGFKTKNGLSMNGNVMYNGESRAAVLNTTVKIGDGADARYCDIYETTLTMPKGTALIKITKTGTYYQGVVLKVLMTTPKNQAIANQKVKITFSNGKSATVTTNDKGIAAYTIPFAPGTYSASASAVSTKSTTAKVTGIKVIKASAVLVPYKLSTTYASGKYFQVKVVNSKTKHVMPNVRLTLKVYTGKKFKTVTVTSNSAGIARYSASTLALGTHKIVVGVKDTKFVTASAKTSSVKVSKASMRISAPKVTNSPNTGTFKVTVQNRASGKGVAGVKVNVKVYTETGYRIYAARTNSAGVVSISTDSLDRGVHNVVITVAKTAKYNGASAKSTITIEEIRVDTHIQGKGASKKVLGGELSSFSATFNLLDSNNNPVTGKLTAQLKLNNGVACSDVVTGNANTEFSLYPSSHASDYASMTVVVTYAGDSTHKPCTAEFYI